VSKAAASALPKIVRDIGAVARGRSARPHPFAPRKLRRPARTEAREALQDYLALPSSARLKTIAGPNARRGCRRSEAT
jgi:hypothetical protein